MSNTTNKTTDRAPDVMVTRDAQYCVITGSTGYALFFKRKEVCHLLELLQSAILKMPDDADGREAQWPG